MLVIEDKSLVVILSLNSNDVFIVYK